MELAQRKLQTRIGPLYLVASGVGLRGVFWKEQTLTNSAIVNGKVASILTQAEAQIQAYLRGDVTRFDLPLDAEGTTFQKKVWQELSRIPFGETRSYKQIATALGIENASRAVGTANGKNPLCLVVPCHRVISADGTLGGYSGGLEIKKMLLRLESSLSPKGRVERSSG